MRKIVTFTLILRQWINKLESSLLYLFVDFLGSFWSCASHFAFWKEVLRGRQLLQAMYQLESLVHKVGRGQHWGLLFDLTVRVEFFQAVSLCVCTLWKALLLHMQKRVNTPQMEVCSGEQYLEMQVPKIWALFCRILNVWQAELYPKEWYRISSEVDWAIPGCVWKCFFLDQLKSCWLPQWQ